MRLEVTSAWVEVPLSFSGTRGMMKHPGGRVRRARFTRVNGLPLLDTLKKKRRWCWPGLRGVYSEIKEKKLVKIRAYASLDYVSQ